MVKIDKFFRMVIVFGAGLILGLYLEDHRAAFFSAPAEAQAQSAEYVVDVVGKVKNNVNDFGTDVVTSTRYLIRDKNGPRFIDAPMFREGVCPKFLLIRESDSGKPMFVSPVDIE